MKASDAFDICHEIYAAAREMVDSRLPTMQLDSASKFLWRPDRRPRLVEYVADFALAGQRALTESRGLHTRGAGLATSTCGKRPSPRALREGAERAALHGIATVAAAISGRASAGNCHAGDGELRASRLILFRLYYLGGAEYQAARRLLGISELTWSQWTDEIRTRVGRELVRAGMFPPGRYFRQPTDK